MYYEKFERTVTIFIEKMKALGQDERGFKIERDRRVAKIVEFFAIINIRTAI